MATRVTCCLNLPLPNPNLFQSSPDTKNASGTVRTRREEETGIRKYNRALGLACLAVGVLQMGRMDEAAVAVAAAAAVEPPLKQENKNVGRDRWSDKRMCPPWRVNSLETIVPENLPRPAARRRWEAVGLGEKNAPPVKVVIKRVSKATCFSM